MTKFSKFIAVCACLGLVFALSAFPAMAAKVYHPNITADPGTGIPGMPAEVKGTGFKKNAQVTVSFSENEVTTGTADSAGNVVATFTVPMHSEAGAHTVKAQFASGKGKKAATYVATAQFIVSNPALSLSANAGNPNDTVTATGNNYGANEGVDIFFDGDLLLVASADVNGHFARAFTIPAAASFGNHTVTATGVASGLSFSVTFDVNSGPKITSVTPSIGPPTSTVTVKGQDFPPGDLVTLYFDNTQISLAQADAAGGWTSTFQIPNFLFSPGTTDITAVKAGNHLITAEGDVSAQVTFVVSTFWPQFRFNARHSGTNPTENNLNLVNATQLQERWETALSNIAIWSSPAYANINGRFVEFVVAQDIGGVAALWMVDDATGIPIAVQPIGIGPVPIIGPPPPLFLGASSPAVDPVNNIVVVTGSDTEFGTEGRVYAFDVTATSMTLRYQTELPSPSMASPTLVNGKVFVGCFASTVTNTPNFFRIDEFTGNRDWSVQVGGPGANIYSSAAYDAVNNKLFVGTTDAFRGLYRVDAGSGGRTLWGTFGFDVFSSPSVSNGLVFWGDVFGFFAAQQADFPNFQWVNLLVGQVFASPAVCPASVVVDPNTSDLVIIGDTAGFLYAFDTLNGFLPNVFWPRFLGGSFFSSPAVASGWLKAVAVPGLVFVGNTDHQLYALTVGLADIVWSGATSGPIISSPFVADGKVGVASNDNDGLGRLHHWDIPTP